MGCCWGAWVWPPFHEGGLSEVVALLLLPAVCTGVMIAAEAHSAEVNCIAFNPLNPNILATGSADKTVSSAHTAGAERGET